jgi:uncharacterized protein (UPF0332 family)
VVTPEEFLAEAERLLKTARREMDYRNSVVNAYYAAYHAALKLEEALPQQQRCCAAQ